MLEKLPNIPVFNTRKVPGPPVQVLTSWSRYPCIFPRRFLSSRRTPRFKPTSQLEKEILSLGPPHRTAHPLIVDGLLVNRKTTVAENGILQFPLQEDDVAR